MSRRLRALGALDVVLHKTFDGYINHHLPGWGLIDLWIWHVCNAYEGQWDREHAR